ncbi:uncharacterized protein LOC125677232 isoform X2 [Ostrea edulis]|uniref:uncharacterized protein LOC125677232 isoform X2 n=1 Tax=Ostrea edulis TaxID=37623 RepID=UPI0024AF6B8B|nr:uncharacterized protein LOC125677232 isoform X2 [Ostrea edulis]
MLILKQLYVLMPGLDKNSLEKKNSPLEDDNGEGESTDEQGSTETPTEEEGAVGGWAENENSGQRRYINIDTDVTQEVCVENAYAEDAWMCSHCHGMMISVFAASFEVEELSVFLIHNVLYIEGNHPPRHHDITTPARTFTQTFVIPDEQPDHLDMSSITCFTNGDYLCVCIPSYLNKPQN